MTFIPLRGIVGHPPCSSWARGLEGPSKGIGLSSSLHSPVPVRCMQGIIPHILCEAQPGNQLWFYPLTSLLSLSLRLCFQRGSICCFRNTSSNLQLSAFRAALSPLTYISYAWKPQESLVQETIVPQLPSPALDPHQPAGVVCLFTEHTRSWCEIQVVWGSLATLPGGGDVPRALDGWRVADDRIT